MQICEICNCHYIIINKRRIRGHRHHVTKPKHTRHVSREINDDYLLLGTSLHLSLNNNTCIHVHVCLTENNMHQG